MHRVCITKRPREIYESTWQILNKEKWYSQVIWMFSTFKEYCLLPKKEMRSRVALCMFLKKILSYPYRCKDLFPLFGWNSASFDIYTQSYLSTSPSQTRVIEFNFLQSPYLQRYADTVTRKGAPLYNCYNFIGGTIARICLPVLNERVVYSHDTRAHGVKFQTALLQMA